MSRSYANALGGVQKKTFREFADMVAAKPNRLVINVVQSVWVGKVENLLT